MCDLFISTPFNTLAEATRESNKYPGSYILNSREYLESWTIVNRYASLGVFPDTWIPSPYESILIRDLSLKPLPRNQFFQFVYGTKL